MTYRLFCSDIHLSQGTDDTLMPGEFPYAWFTSDDAKRATDFFDGLAKQTKPADEIVLLGDIFDDAVVPHDRTPLTIPEIAARPTNAPVIQALKALSRTVPVVYLPGNHDMFVTADALREILPDVTYGGDGVNQPAFVSGRLRAEHGNAHALFTAPDPMRKGRVPLGYFLSRLAATAVRKNGKRIRSPLTIVDDVLELLGPARLAEAVLDATREEAGLRETDAIKMPKALNNGEDIAIGDIRKTYAAVYDEWRARAGSGAAFKAVLGEIGMLDDAADRVCKNTGAKVMLFGHTHEPAIDKDTWFVDDRIYANTGAMCEGKCTYASVEKTESGKMIVSVWQIVSGDARVIHGPEEVES